jgi:hypothetical protein
MTINLPNYLLLIASLLITIHLIKTIISTIQSIRQSIRKREKDNEWKNNHPELMNVNTEEDELLCFSSGEGLRQQVLMNEEETDNIPLMVKLMDEMELDDDD